MKILYVCPDVFVNDSIGGSIHVQEVTSVLADLNHSLILVGRKSNNAFPFKEKIETHFVYGINKPLIHSITYSMFSFIVSFYILLTKKIDIIYERHNVFGIGTLLGKLFRVPVISEVNGLFIDEALLMGAYGNCPGKILKKMESLILRNTGKIVCVAKSINNKLLNQHSIPEAKFKIIENGVNTDIFMPMNIDKELIDLKNSLGIQSNDFVITHLGYMERWQHIEQALESMPLVLDHIPCKLLIVGDGPTKIAMMDKGREMGIEKNIIFTGIVPYQEVPKYMALSDVGLALKHKSISQSPLKLYAYMACGKPVIATDSEDFSLLKQYQTGILVDPEKPEEISNAIIKLYNDNELRRQMAINARENAVKNHSWHSVGRKISDLCADVFMQYSRKS